MHGLYLLWWVQEKDLSPAVVAAILAAGDLALMAIEVPTGWAADRFGHRASLITGSAVQTLGILWCWLGDGIAGLVVASVLVALGDSFRSGADQALLYRTCAALDIEDAFQRIEARIRAVETAALVGLVLAGGLIVRTWGFAAGWIAEAVLCVLGLALACAMVEPAARETSEPHAPTGSNSSVPYSGEAAPVLRFAWARRMMPVLLPAALLGGAASAASFLAQVNGSSDAAVLTVIVAAIALAEAAGSAVATRVPTGGVRTQVLLAAIGSVLAVVALAAPTLVVAAAPALAFLHGLSHPLRATLVQRAASEHTRARMASLANACDMAVSTIALPLAGGLARRR